MHNPPIFTESEQQQIDRAKTLAFASDAATFTHAVAAIPLAVHIATHDQPSWGETGFHLAASSLDLADGWLKDRAVRLGSRTILKSDRNLRTPNQRPTSDEKVLLSSYGITDRPSMDEKVDKGYFYAVAGALTVRFAKNGHTAAAVLMGFNTAVAATRDELKRRQRGSANEYGISVHATRTGKEKTKLQNIGLGVLCSPVAKFAIGRAVGLGCITYSTGLGLKDYRQYRSFVRHEKARMGVL